MRAESVWPAEKSDRKTPWAKSPTPNGIGVDYTKVYDGLVAKQQQALRAIGEMVEACLLRPAE
jgi:hypothetical protein